MSNYKLLLVGDNGVGKTTLIHRLLNGEFISNYKPTEDNGIDIDLLKTQHRHMKALMKNLKEDMQTLHGIRTKDVESLDRFWDMGVMGFLKALACLIASNFIPCLNSSIRPPKAEDTRSLVTCIA